MRLTRYTDYALRVLIYLGLHPGEVCTIAEIAAGYDISENHLMKVVHQLGQFGFINTVRGRGGGISLARPPGEIRIGDVVRLTEEDLVLVECFEPRTNKCRITSACGLNHALSDALAAFLKVLDGYSLADVLASPQGLQALLE